MNDRILTQNEVKRIMANTPEALKLYNEGLAKQRKAKDKIRSGAVLTTTVAFSFIGLPLLLPGIKLREESYQCIEQAVILYNNRDAINSY